MPPASQYRGMGLPSDRPAKSVLGPILHQAQKLNGPDTKTQLRCTIKDVIKQIYYFYRFK